jgi:hypothetical protein
LTTAITLNPIESNRSNDSLAVVLGCTFGVIFFLILAASFITYFFYKQKKYCFDKSKKNPEKYLTEDKQAYENEIKRDSIDHIAPSSPSNSDYKTAAESGEDKNSVQDSSISDKIGEIVQIRELDEISDGMEMKERKQSLQSSLGNDDTKSDIDHFSSGSQSDMIDIIDADSINMQINETFVSVKGKNAAGVSTDL